MSTGPDPRLFPSERIRFAQDKRKAKVHIMVPDVWRPSMVLCGANLKEAKEYGKAVMPDVLCGQCKGKATR